MQESEYKKTLKELEQAERKSAELITDIKNIVDILTNEELTLTDIIANEEQLKNACLDLQDTAKEIIKLRQWLDFINSEPRL